MKHPGLARHPDVVLSEELDGWGVLFDTRSAAAMELNPVGVIVWRLLDGQLGLDEVVEEVRHLCADVPNTVDEDVSAFVELLAECGLIGCPAGDEQG